MKTRHVAFVCYPFPAFVNPTLPIVSVLVRRGYRVSYVTTDDFSTRVVALGADVIRCPSISLDGVIDPDDPEAGNELYLSRFFEWTVKTIEIMTKAWNDERPEFVLYQNLAPAAHIWARRINIPAVQLNPTFVFDRGRFHRQIKDAKYRLDIVDLSKRLDAFIERQGVRSNDYLFTREKLAVHLFPRALQPLSEVFGTSVFYAGRCAGEQPYYGTWCPSAADGRPIVLVSTSTMYVRGPEYFKMCIEALAGLKVHVVMSIGESNAAASLGSLPSHFEVVQHNAHVRILRYVSLFLYIGGSTSTSEAMYHGVPLILLSHGFKEMEVMGDILENLGTGIHLPKADMSVPNIRTFAAQILSDSAMLDRVQQMRRIVRQEPGAEETVNRLEEYLEREEYRQ